jgi:2-polyprenyl-6-hydroxyphenyl methylase/3-demethylubiquinone-9 3-methyltransferase
LFGPYERGAAEAYRRIFIDLDDFVARTEAWVPEPRRILEVGCGEGAVTERLARAFPTATITATDITPAVGRLYRGPAARVNFIQGPVERVAENAPRSFDLVVLSDVLHHVPPVQRHALLSAIDRAMAPGGSLIFKDWAPSVHPIHWLCGFADRYITGDDVDFCTKPELAALLTEVFGAGAIRDEAAVRPWANNVAFLVCR